MPRTRRLKSETGIYHVILRGINKQIIFEDDEDHEMFL
ncbi:MAG: REP-associated tyrosine transposase, partial [Thermotogaceae bacterium]|nr:REP-associated tyrosine transposase [Thermotogaceae bacterium]